MDKDFQKIVQGYGLTTASILYHLPDYPSLFQEFIWQEYDLYPRFPKLQEFLGFWETNLDGKLKSIILAHTRLIKPAELKLVGSVFQLH